MVVMDSASVDSFILIFRQPISTETNIQNILEVVGFMPEDTNLNPYQLEYFNTENPSLKLSYLPELGYASSFLAETNCEEDDWEIEVYNELSKKYIENHIIIKDYISAFISQPTFDGVKGDTYYPSEFTTVERCSFWLSEGKYILLETDRAQHRDAFTTQISIGLDALVSNRFIRLGAN